MADEAAWQGRLTALGIPAVRVVRLRTDGALLGGGIDHGVSPDLPRSATERANATSWSAPPAGGMPNAPGRG